MFIPVMMVLGHSAHQGVHWFVMDVLPREASIGLGIVAIIYAICYGGYWIFRIIRNEGW
jgi:hypothetical protein